MYIGRLSVCFLVLNSLGDRLIGHQENLYMHVVLHGVGSQLGEIEV